MPAPDWHLALSAALFAAARGLHVFPLARSKRPAVPSPHPDDPHCKGACGHLGHGVHDATTDPDKLRELFEAAPWATAYGIACGRGPHHLIGLDLDVKHGADGPDNLRALAAHHGFRIPPTPTVATPSGGRHLWLTAPPDARITNSAGTLAPGIDVRGTAGYLVGPGSRTAAGLYAFAPGTDPALTAPAPPALLALLTTPPAPVTPVPDSDTLRRGIRVQSAYVRAVLDGEDAKVRAQKQPGRKKRLFASAARLGQLIATGTVPEPLAHDVLTAAGLACGLTDTVCERTIRRGFDRGTGTTPHAT
ncbi:bifunctional DNA primase/polymerase [Kitasatospora sp. NPDC101183]|uniref:bifunctional DNA primase/polymerase n=1 Tax=Kitasatospora sp. NPDC101183 TaxID=3364100 RepID=UPI00380BD2EE